MERMLVTEVLVKGESEHVVVPRDEIKRLVETMQLAGVFKFGIYPRDDVPDTAVKAVHSFKGDFLNPARPVASSTISSAEVDRDGDILESTGVIITDNFRQNPVVLPSHAHTFPVGFDRKLKVSKDRVWAAWEWLVDVPETPAQVYQRLWDAHVLNCTSVGFIPIPGEWEEIPETWGWLFRKWELLEHSPVVIPSNREAMRTDGIKEYVRQYAEAIAVGPSPIAKGLWNAADAALRPKQVAVSKPTEPVASVSSETSGEEDTDTPAAEPTQVDAVATVAMTVEKGVITYGAAHPDGTPKAPKDEAWDGPAEVAAAEVSDLKVMCTWVDSEEPDNKGSYKLPHHKVSGHAVVWRGVTAAMGALLGARGGVNIPDADRKGVYNHLARHYKEFDEEPPEFKDYSAEELYQRFPELYADFTWLEWKASDSGVVLDGEKLVRRVLTAWRSGTLSEDEATWLICGYLESMEAEKKEAVAKLAELAAKVVKKSGGDRWKT